MNLTTLFNVSFFKENLKKSRGILIFLFTLIPVMTFITFLVMGNSTNSGQFLPSLVGISVPCMIAMFFMPTILSIVLFSFCFKKKSVDFINSMPIKRKTIFITNTIGGMAIFLGLFLITILLMLLFNIIFPKIVIPSSMYVYYFMIWFVSYTFIFISSNLAATLSGNMITQIAVTLLILFLPGTMIDFGISRLYSADDVQDRIHQFGYASDGITYTSDTFKIKNELQKSGGTNTIPYKYVRLPFVTAFGIYSYDTNDLEDVYSLSSTLNMIGLSIIYFMVGLYLFQRRKMEVCETTFQSHNIHNFVRDLTLIPFLLLSYVYVKAVDDFGIGIFIIFTLIVIYYFVYDLITKRNISKVKSGMVHFISTCVIVMIVCVIVEFIGNDLGERQIQREDVKSIAVLPSRISLEDEDSTGKMLDYFMEDLELIDLLFKYAGIDYNRNYGNNYISRHLCESKIEKWKHT